MQPAEMLVTLQRKVKCESAAADRHCTVTDRLWLCTAARDI